MSDISEESNKTERVGAAAAMVFLVAAAGTMVGSCLRSFVQLGEALAERRDRKNREARKDRVVKVPVRPAAKPVAKPAVLKPASTPLHQVQPKE